jgi:hypothetical protein
MLTSPCARRLRLCAVAVSVAALPAFAQTGSSQAVARDKAFWQAVIKNEFKVPAGTPVPVLLTELSGMLSSPDPELRDDIAYSVLANWIYRQRVVPVEERLRLLQTWEGNLKSGIGERDTNTVVGRSFSALALGVLAILDNEAPYLDRATFARLLESALTYLKAEQDVRGFDNRLGWLHSVAHTADVLKFLARNPHLQIPQQALVLNAIGEKLSVVNTPLVHGEDERLARAVLSIVTRTDFDETGFAAWLKAMAPIRRATAPTAVTLAIDQNRRDLLVTLFMVLSTDRRELPGLTRARTLVLDSLRGA